MFLFFNLFWCLPLGRAQNIRLPNDNASIILGPGGSIVISRTGTGALTISSNLTLSGVDLVGELSRLNQTLGDQANQIIALTTALTMLALKCPPLPAALLTGAVTSSCQDAEYTQGTACLVACQTGYGGSPVPRIVSCGLNGVWSANSTSGCTEFPTVVVPSGGTHPVGTQISITTPSFPGAFYCFDLQYSPAEPSQPVCGTSYNTCATGIFFAGGNLGHLGKPEQK
jgi:hypothetical protein